jgi:hypothetical protein
METIRAISCSIPVNRGGNHLIDKPIYLPCTSTQNVQNTNIPISLSNKYAEKTQDEVITKLDAPLRFLKIKIKQIKSAKDLTRNRILICLEKISATKKFVFKNID